MWIRLWNYVKQKFQHENVSKIENVSNVSNVSKIAESSVSKLDETLSNDYETLPKDCETLRNFEKKKQVPKIDGRTKSRTDKQIAAYTRNFRKKKRPLSKPALSKNYGKHVVYDSIFK